MHAGRNGRIWQRGEPYQGVIVGIWLLSRVYKATQYDMIGTIIVVSTREWKEQMLWQLRAF